MTSSIDEVPATAAVLETFLTLCAAPSPSHHEGPAADVVRQYLAALNVEVHEDDAATTIPAGCGNLYVNLPATAHGTPIFMCSHLDTVTLEDDVVPGVIEAPTDHPAGAGTPIVVNHRETILGGDNKAAVAVMLELIRELVQSGAPHAGLEVIFTPCEEVGLLGAKAFDASRLQASFGFVFDHANDIGLIVAEAPTQISIRAEFIGVASHSGIAPEAGRSAIRAAADAVAAMPHGRIDARTTANAGLISGGSATNIVPEHCTVRAEVRSLDHDTCAKTVQQVVAAFTDAGTRHQVDVQIQAHEEYRGYQFTENAPVVRHAIDALTAAGHQPKLVPCGGGSDANVFNLAKVPCANVPNAMRMIHTRDEYVEVADLARMLEVARQLVYRALDESGTRLD